MEYLKHVLGVDVEYTPENIKGLPNFIFSRYRIQKVMIEGKEALFLYPKEELEAVNTIKKHIARIQKEEDIPVIIVLDKLTYRQREYMIRDHIPFIVKGKHIYLPFLGIYLQERRDVAKEHIENLLPSAGGEHATTVNGNGTDPGMEDLIDVVRQVRFDVSKARSIAKEIQEIVYCDLGGEVMGRSKIIVSYTVNK